MENRSFFIFTGTLYNLNRDFIRKVLVCVFVGLRVVKSITTKCI